MAKRLLVLACALMTTPVWATDMGMGRPPVVTMFSAELLETQVRNGDNAYVWDVEAWRGNDINKAFLRTEGEYDDGEGMENAELQLLYSRAVLAFWDLQMGLRHDFRPNPSKTYAVAALDGEAPFRVEVEASAFVSEDGDASARLELEYDLFLTQYWIVQPRMELDFAFSQVSELQVGRGPNQLETGLRLRYQWRQECAPYLGVAWESALGDTRGLLNDANEDRSTWSFVLGLRTWF